MSAARPGLPDWLAVPAEVAPPARRQHPFLRASLRRAEALAATVHADDGAIDRLDPRMKLVGSLMVLVVLAVLRSPWILTGAMLVLVGLAAARGVGRPLRVVATPVLVMTGVLLLPATLSIVRPGSAVVPLWSRAGSVEGMTDLGLRNAWMVLARVLACLTVAVLLTRTTSWLRLMASLRAIGTPAGFVMIATMAHRYLVVLLDGLADLLLARRARSIGGATGTEDRRFVGGAVGHLFVRSGELADQVHDAMVARGFSGRLVDPTPRPVRAADALFGAACVAASVALVWGDLLVR